MVVVKIVIIVFEEKSERKGDESGGKDLDSCWERFVFLFPLFFTTAWRFTFPMCVCVSEYVVLYVNAFECVCMFMCVCHMSWRKLQQNLFSRMTGMKPTLCRKQSCHSHV